MSEAEQKARSELLAFARTLGINTADDIGKVLKVMGFGRRFAAKDLEECKNLLKSWHEQKLKQEEQDRLTGRREELKRMVDRGLEYRPHKERNWNILKHMFVQYETKEERDASKNNN